MLDPESPKEGRRKRLHTLTTHENTELVSVLPTLCLAWVMELVVRKWRAGNGVTSVSALEAVTFDRSGLTTLFER